MRTSTLMVFTLALAVCVGCTTVREYNGSAANLRGNGERLPAGTHLEVSVSCSGKAPGGERYVALRLRPERCWLVLFHPPVEAGSSFRGDTTNGAAGAWLIRGKRPDGATLSRSGREAAFLAVRGERLHGQIEVLWRNEDDFYIPVELDSETAATDMDGQFTAYTALWGPLVGPALLLGFPGARAPKQ